MREIVFLLVVAVVALGLSRAAFAQPPRTVAANAANVGAARGTSSHSARPAHDRSAEIMIAAARQKENDGDFAEALAQYEDAARTAPDSYLLEGDVWRSIPSLADAAGRRAALAARRNATVDQALARHDRDVARTLGETSARDLRSLFLSSRDVSWSRPALGVFHAAALRQFERGRYDSAAATLRAVAGHPRVDVGLRARAAALEIVALHRAGRAVEAAARVEAARDLLAQSREPAPDGAANLAVWVATQRARPPARSLEDSVYPRRDQRDGLGGAARRLELPSIDAVWRLDAVVPAEVATLLHDSADELRGQGVAVVSSARPLVAGSTVVARVLDDLVACDLETGAVRWRKPVGPVWSQLTGNLKLLQNDGFADMISRRLVYRTQADGLYSRATSDGTRVFVLREVESTGASLSRPGQMTGDPTANIGPGVFNLLSARDLETGEELWSVGGPAPAKLAPAKSARANSGRPVEGTPPETKRQDDSTPQQPSGEWARGVFFLGPPTVVESELYVLGKVESSRVLFALHATDGELLWRLPLVDTSDEPPQGESRPLPAACVPCWHEGMLLCPTAQGAVIAVDAFLQRGVWCRRFPRDDVGRAGAAAQNPWNRQLLYPWWDGWREADLLARDGRCVVAGPDSNTLIVLDAATGRSLWSRPREDGVHVAAIGAHGVVVVGEHTARCFDAATGNPRWTAAVGPVVGRGAHDEATIVLPLADGGLATLDWNTGRVRRTPGEGEALGNLVLFPGGAVAQTTERLARLRPLSERLDAARAAATPDSPAALRTLARRQHEAGDLAAATAAVESARAKSDDAETRAQLAESLLTRVEANPELSVELWAKIEPLVDTPEARVRALDRIARCQRRAGQVDAALASWLRLLELGPTGDWSSVAALTTSPRNTTQGAAHRERDADEGARVVRYDRHVQGEIADLLASSFMASTNSTTASRGPLLDLMDGALDAAIRSPDPFSIQRFADRHGGLAWGRRVRLREAAKSSLGVGFLKTQIALLDLATHADRTVAATALRQYAALLDDRGYRTDAALAYRRLLDEFADAPLDDGDVARQVVSAVSTDALLGRRIADGPPSPWPQETPKAEAVAERNRDTEFIPLPVTTSSGSLFERISVSIDRAGKRLRFHGGEQRAAWELALPETKSMFRTAHPLHRGWAWGHLLVARIGSELFAVSPFNEQGDPKASIAWRVDMYGQRATKWNQLGVKLSPMPAGFGLDDVTLVDRFGRELGRIGPAQAGYLCFRDQARLVALDTATGVRLWERHNLPVDAVVAGDAERIILALPETGRVEVLRSLDGATIRTLAAPIPSHQVLAWHGVRALALHDGKLQMVDFAEARPLWELAVEPGSLPFAMDDRRCGLVAPGGVLRVVELADGTVANAARVAGMERIDRVHSTLDERNCYVALGGPFQNPDNQRIQSDRGGFRSPPVSGRLVALSRESGRVLWDVPHEDASLPYEQPRETPFLVIQHWRAGAGANGAENPIAIQRLLDKRTGAELHRSTRSGGELGWHIIDPNADQRRIDLRDAQQTVRVRWE